MTGKVCFVISTRCVLQETNTRIKMVSSSEKIVLCVILCCALSGAVFGETGDEVTQEPVGVRNDLIEGSISSNEPSGSIDFRRVIRQPLEIPLNFPEGRTFGHHFLKRISFAIIPAAFVVGVITTLLAALTVVSIKGLGVWVSAISKVNGSHADDNILKIKSCR